MLRQLGLLLAPDLRSVANLLEDAERSLTGVSRFLDVVQVCHLLDDDEGGTPWAKDLREAKAGLLTAQTTVSKAVRSLTGR